MIKLVAFDWNGTIFSDTTAILDADNAVLKVFKLKPISLTTLQKHFDVPVSKMYLAFGVSKEDVVKKSSLIAQTFHAYYEKRVSKVRTRANAGKLLDWIAKNNIQSIIFSNHIDGQIKKQLRRLKIEKYLSTVLANSQLEAALSGRSKSDKLKSFMINNHFLATETLIVGDTIEEIEIGKELGVITVAITHGNCSTIRLKAAKPDYLIKNLGEVINIIRKMSS